MNNNDILRSLRYTFDISDSKMIQLFGLGGLEVTRTEISDWLKGEDDAAFKPIYDKDLAVFLNGFITYKRGKKDGEPLPNEKSLNNNIVLRKLKIALNLQDDNIVSILKLKGFEVSKHEISAFFRSPTQGKYMACKDQFLRNFLMGLQVKFKIELS